MNRAKGNAYEGPFVSKKAIEEIHFQRCFKRNARYRHYGVRRHGDIDGQNRFEPLEKVIDNLRTEIRNRHVKRLRKAKCTIEMGFVLTDLITNYERVADHCSNIAVCMIQIHDNSFDTHSYISDLKATNSEEFAESSLFSVRKYMLPDAKENMN